MRALATVLKVPPVNSISAHDNPTEVERAAPHCGPTRGTRQSRRRLRGSARALVVPSPLEAGSLKEATMADTTNTPTVHTAEVVCYDDR